MDLVLKIETCFERRKQPFVRISFLSFFHQNRLVLTNMAFVAALTSLMTTASLHSLRGKVDGNISYFSEGPLSRLLRHGLAHCRRFPVPRQRKLFVTCQLWLPNKDQNLYAEENYSPKTEHFIYSCTDHQTRQHALHAHTAARAHSSTAAFLSL
jgi:hypothetical protein